MAIEAMTLHRSGDAGGARRWLAEAKPHRNAKVTCWQTINARPLPFGAS